LGAFQAVWKKNKGNAIFLALAYPFARSQVRQFEASLEKYNKTFIESNKKLKEMLPKAERESRKMFLTTFIELNTTAIEMNSLLLEENEKSGEAKKRKEALTQNPTTENLLCLWHTMKDVLLLETKIAQLMREKADTQDKVIEYEREMTKFDKKDIEDFSRAILTDLAISAYEQKIMIVGTPIEVLLKSSKILNRIRKALFLSEVLRIGAELREESNSELLNCFAAYEEKTCNETQKS
jgi:hypothetical protein